MCIYIYTYYNVSLCWNSLVNLLSAHLKQGYPNVLNALLAATRLEIMCCNQHCKSVYIFQMMF